MEVERRRLRQPIQCYPERENQITEVPQIVNEVLRSAGQPLDPETRKFMESRFAHEFSQLRVHSPAQSKIPTQMTVVPLIDRSELEADQAANRVAYGSQSDLSSESFSTNSIQYDFSHVRIHANARAAESAWALSAHAYTVGQDIVFGSGQYAPATRKGRELVAHELMHTLQQTNGSRPSIQRKLKVSAGLSLDRKGFTMTKTGNVYTCSAIVKNSIWNELFTSLLASPRIFKIDGTSNTQINDNINNNMKARKGIVEFASKKQYTFGAGPAFKMNPAYWIVDSTGWHLKPGADRLNAIADLNVHPQEYSIACTAATQLTMEGGGKSALTDDIGVAATDWIPGDWGYVRNTKFPSSGQVGLEGENIIYTGKNKFWGHFGLGNTYKTLQEWFDEVKSWHGGAKTEDFRTRPTVGVV